MIERFEAGERISEQDWQRYVQSLKSNITQSTVQQASDAIVEAVRKRVPKGKFGVLLSGGVDSSLIALLAKRFSDDLVCYTVGLKDSPDVKAATIMAKSLGCEWKLREFDIDEVLPFLQKSAKMIGWDDPVQIGIGAVVIAGVELAKEDGVTVIFGGLGAEEVYAGYQRHVIAKDVNAECWKGLLNLAKVDLARDYALGFGLKVSVKVPFLDEQVIITAMGLSGGEKIVDGERKVVFRKIAQALGVPKEIAWRKKQAAQYGSGFDKALERLAKKTGMTKGEFVKSIIT